jgi:SAM-dependent methyltransferase
MIRKHISKPLKRWVKKKILNTYIEYESGKKEIKVPIIYFPYLEEERTYKINIEKDINEFCELNLPVPPEDLWLGFGRNQKEYLYGGKVQVKKMLEILSDAGFDLAGKKRALELGCGSGRMIRWLKPYSEKCEIWGTDISSEHIYWANKYLKPPFNFATTTTIPHLPFEDKHFDLIYAGSVFTHIDDLTDAWFLELRRILSDDGMIYVTIHDKHTIELIKDHPIWKDSKAAKLVSEFPKIESGEDNFGLFVTLRGPESQVFYDIDYFCESVRNIFNVVSITQEAYGYQTAVLLKRKID